jgi:hypothetical protein
VRTSSRGTIAEVRQRTASLAAEIGDAQIRN